MEKIELDGGRFSNLKGFYDEVERSMTSGLGWKIGRNLDAFDEITVEMNACLAFERIKNTN